MTTAAPIICAGCKDVIQMPGTYLQVRGKNYHEQCVWKCVGYGYGNYAPITVTKQPSAEGKMKRQASKADPFSVWGSPPEVVLMQLGKRDHDRLRRYVDRTAKKVYRLAYDLGAERVEQLRQERDELRSALANGGTFVLVVGPDLVTVVQRVKAEQFNNAPASGEAGGVQKGGGK